MRWPSLDTNHFCVSHDLVQRLGQVGTVLGHRRRRPHEQIALVGERDGERVDHALTRPRPGHRHARHELGRVPRDQGAGGGDLGRLGARVAHGAIAEVRNGEEPPSRADEGPHPDARVGVLGDRLDLAVAGRHRLVTAVHDPGIGVAGAGVERGLHGRLGGVELAHAVLISCGGNRRETPRWSRCTGTCRQSGGTPRMSSMSSTTVLEEPRADSSAGDRASPAGYRPRCLRVPSIELVGVVMAVIVFVCAGTTSRCRYQHFAAPTNGRIWATPMPSPMAIFPKIDDRPNIPADATEVARRGQQRLGQRQLSHGLGGESSAAPLSARRAAHVALRRHRPRRRRSAVLTVRQPRVRQHRHRVHVPARRRGDGRLAATGSRRGAASSPCCRVPTTSSPRRSTMGSPSPPPLQSSGRPFGCCERGHSPAGLALRRRHSGGGRRELERRRCSIAVVVVGVAGRSRRFVRTSRIAGARNSARRSITATGALGASHDPVRLVLPAKHRASTATSERRAT